MKKILFTVSNDLSFDQRMIRICTSLSKAGYDVSIIGFTRTLSDPLPDKPYRQIRLPLIFQRGKLFYLEICVRLFFKLLFSGTELICAVDMDTLFPAWLVAKLRSRKLVFDAHEYYSETSGLVGRKFEKFVWASLEKFLIPKVKFAYTVNSSLAGIFKKKFDTDFKVIMNLPVLERNDDTVDKSHFYLYQGVLNKGRGLEELIEVFSELDLYLKIAGRGPVENELMEFIEFKDCSDRVELLGYVPPEELKTLSRRAFAGFNLIEGIGKSYYYSLANKFFDYMHAGIPQICMNFPEYKAINDKYEVAILLDDFSQIRKAIFKLENDTGLYQNLLQNTKKARNEYQWEFEEKKLISFYSDLF